MKYQLVCEYSAAALSKEVAALLSAGWQLQGGVSVSAIDHAEHVRGTVVFVQAMVRAGG